MHATIAARLRAQLKSGQLHVLPSVRILARQNGVSYRTMWKAVRELANEGLIRVRRGTKIEAAGESRPGAAATLASLIYRDILDGVYRARQPLPKFDVFLRTHAVACSTVADAFAILQSRNCIHKQGKRWIAGPSPVPAREKKTVPPRFILVVVPSQGDWYELFNNFFLAPFITMLRTECAIHNVRLLLILTEKTGRGYPPALCGVDGVRQAIHEHGDRLLGAIIADSFAGRDAISAIVREISAGKRPVAYLDGAGNRDDLDTIARDDGLRFHRMALDEHAAVTMAIGRLAAAGHRSIGFPTLGKRSPDWLLRRLQTAQSIVERDFPNVKLVTAAQEEPVWLTFNETPADLYRTAADRFAAVRSARSLIASAQRRLLAATPSMASMLKQGATALISANDRMACQHYFWCRSAGIRVPQRLSMVSFDNIPESEIFPVSTIDFGLGQLGYLAAHLLLGDIPMQFDKSGCVRGRCTFIDRGSIAVPRDG